MQTKTALKKAIDLVGLKAMATELGITHQAIRGWQDRNRMPDSEYSGRTKHASKIQLLTDHKVKVEDLLEFVPKCQIVEVPEKVK